MLRSTLEMKQLFYILHDLLIRLFLNIFAPSLINLVNAKDNVDYDFA